MILIVDTTRSHAGRRLLEELEGERLAACEWLDATKLKILPCIGCNYCWLKTPGICAVKDDYAEILQKSVRAEQLWIVADTRFGFLSHEGKNVVDRLLPLLVMNLHFKGGEMRHIPRYERLPDLGVVYCGDGDKAYLERWTGRMALNLASGSLGAYSIDEIEEAPICI